MNKQDIEGWLDTVNLALTIASDPDGPHYDKEFHKAKLKLIIIQEILLGSQ